MKIMKNTILYLFSLFFLSSVSNVAEVFNAYLISHKKLLLLTLLLLNIGHAQDISKQATSVADSMTSPTLRSFYSIPNSVARSLILDKIKSLNDKTEVNEYGFVGVINDSLLKRHVIVIYQPSTIYGPTLGQTFIISDDMAVTIMAPDYENGFNKMILAERLNVTSFDMAVEVTKLFMRMIFPMISNYPSYFLDELSDSTFQQYMEKTERNEMKIYCNSSAIKVLYNLYYKKVKQDIEKRKWFIQVNKSTDNYIVNIFTTGIIEIGYDFGYYVSPPLIHRTLKWEVSVFPNGTIKAKLPKGIKIYSIFDH